MDDALLVPAVVGPAAMALVLVLALAASRGSLRRNHLAGIRLPATMRSDAAWRAGHRAAVAPAGVSLIVLVLAGVTAVVLGAHRVPESTLVVVLLVSLGASFGWVVLRAVRGADAAGPGRD